MATYLRCFYLSLLLLQQMPVATRLKAPYNQYVPSISSFEFRIYSCSSIYATPTPFHSTFHSIFFSHDFLIPLLFCHYFLAERMSHYSCNHYIFNRFLFCTFLQFANIKILLIIYHKINLYDILKNSLDIYIVTAVYNLIIRTLVIDKLSSIGIFSLFSRK
jgi:hypothetical protein